MPWFPVAPLPTLQLMSGRRESVIRDDSRYMTRGPFDVGCLLTFRCGEAQGLRLGSGHLAEEAYASGRSRGSIQREGQD